MLHYFVIHKPYQVLSQFSAEQGKKTLKDVFDVPSNVYPVGRLDYDSEGLLILTDDKSVTHRLLAPQFAHEREYLVQVEGVPDRDALTSIQSGVSITVDGKQYRTKPCKAISIPEPPGLSARNPPIRFRKNIPSNWLSLTLTEGKNRQVRKMTAAVGFPTLRLIRYRINRLSIEGMQPGEMLMLTEKELYNQLF